MRIISLSEFDDLFSEERECDSSTLEENSVVGFPNLEPQLCIRYAALITNKELDDNPEYPFCSCECLHQRKNVPSVKLTSVDDVTRQVVEVVNNTSSTMLEKPVQKMLLVYNRTLNMDNQLSCKSDIDQYKLLNEREDAIDSRQKYQM